MSIDKETREETRLLEAAKEAMKYAYAPYSKFQVGAALLCRNGKIFTGCNIENATYGATNCAERTAIFKAVSEGEKEFEKIAVVCNSGGFVTPCGICRQVLLEFMKDGLVITVNEQGEVKRFTVEELLPYGFTL